MTDDRPLPDASDAEAITPPPAIAPDGSPVLLYRRLQAGPEPEIVASVVPAGSTVLELGCGAGRVTHPLARLGYRVTAVDESPAMLAWVRDADRVAARIEDLSLRERFDAVLLGSNLVNDPDDIRRQRYLAACARHLADRGVVLIEHHPTDWAETITEHETRVGQVGIALRDVRSEPPLVRATAVYHVDGQTFRQPFSARVLSLEELVQALAAVGLTVNRTLSATWLMAVARPRRSPPTVEV